MKFPIYPENEKDIEKIKRINNCLKRWERYYKRVQIEFKKDAFKWVFATFAAIGFILFKEHEQLQIPSDVLVFIISFCGFFAGVLPYGIYDLMIYQRFIDAIFYEGLKLEKAFPWLAQTSHNALKNSKWKRHTSILTYFCCGAFLFFTSGYFLSVWAFTLSVILGIAVIFSIIILVFCIYLFFHKMHLHFHKIFLRFSLENIAIPSSIPEKIWKSVEEDYEALTLSMLQLERTKIHTKGIISTYFLYVFLGIGIIFSTDAHFITGQGRLLITALISFLGLIGNSIIFRIYMGLHRDLISEVYEGLKLETRYNTLAPIRLNMLASQKGHGIEHLHVLEFLFRNLLLIAVTVFTLICAFAHNIIQTVIFVFIFFLFASGSSLWIIRSSKSSASFLQTSSDVSDNQ